MPNKIKHDNQIFNLFTTLQEYKLKYFFFSPARNVCIFVKLQLVTNTVVSEYNSFCVTWSCVNVQVTIKLVWLQSKQFHTV